MDMSWTWALLAALLAAALATALLATAVLWSRREGMTPQDTLRLGGLQFPNRDVACRPGNRRVDDRRVDGSARRCLSGDTTDLATTNRDACVTDPAAPRRGAACWQRVSHPDALHYMTTGGPGGASLDW